MLQPSGITIIICWTWWTD